MCKSRELTRLLTLRSNNQDLIHSGLFNGYLLMSLWAIDEVLTEKIEQIQSDYHTLTV